MAPDCNGFACIGGLPSESEREFPLTRTLRAPPPPAPLKVTLRASASVLELGKSLALDCTVSGAPIHQVLFRHNQNVIKSIGGPEASGQQRQHHYSNGPQAAGYFVVDSAASSAAEASEARPPQLAPSRPEGEPAAEGEAKLSHVIVIVLEPQHAGAYQCFAHNQFESAHSSAYIRVLDDPPKFKETFRSQVFGQRQDVSLLCSARANPLPEITWSIDEQPIPESSRTRFGDFVTKVSAPLSFLTRGFNSSTAPNSPGPPHRHQRNSGQLGDILCEHKPDSGERQRPVQVQRRQRTGAS